MLAQRERPTSPLKAVSQLARPDTVKAGLTPKRPRRQVENDEYAAFVRRILRAYSPPRRGRRRRGPNPHARPG